jgi:hypothetical protein
VSRHVVFFEHIPFFSIPSTAHSLTKPDLICIDPFSEDSDSDTSPHVRPICTHNSAGTDTLLFGIPEVPFSSTANIIIHINLTSINYNIYIYIKMLHYRNLLDDSYMRGTSHTHTHTHIFNSLDQH